MNPEDLPLRDLHLPAPPGWWPPAPGWWLLMAIAAGLLGWFAWRALSAWLAARPRRVALSSLKRAEAEYAASGDVTRLAKTLSELLRRAMLAYVPRGEVAGLTGEAWLRFLDRGLDKPLFTGGPGRELEALPYRRPADQRSANVDGLLCAVRRRLETPLPEELPARRSKGTPEPAAREQRA